MKHLFKDLISDSEFENNLFTKWLESEQEYDYTTWLKLLVMHRSRGGASNKDMDLLKKTIMVLINHLEKKQ